jgi:hypothetical protein
MFRLFGESVGAGNTAALLAGPLDYRSINRPKLVGMLIGDGMLCCECLIHLNAPSGLLANSCIAVLDLGPTLKDVLHKRRVIDMLVKAEFAGYIVGLIGSRLTSQVSLERDKNRHHIDTKFPVRQFLPAGLFITRQSILPGSDKLGIIAISQATAASDS